MHVTVSEASPSCGPCPRTVYNWHIHHDHRDRLSERNRMGSAIGGTGTRHLAARVSKRAIVAACVIREISEN